MDEPRPTAIDVWLVDLRSGTAGDADGARAVPRSWWLLLDPEERTRAEALRRRADRLDFAAAHAALRVILGVATGTEPAAIDLRPLPCPLCGGPHGRPALVGGGPAFSLSRTRDWAALAVGTVAPVGVDLERVGAATFADLRSALHPDEVTALLALDERDRELAAQRCWVRKEALLKGRGTGLGIDPETVFVGVGAAAATVPRRPVTTEGPAGWSLVDVPVPAAPTATDDESLVVALAHRLGPDAAVTVRSTSVDALLR